MKWNRENARRRRDCVQILAGLTLALMLFATAAQAQAAEANPSAETYKTFYLTNLTQQEDAMSLVTDLRNMLPRAKLYYVASQAAISVRGTPEDIQLAQKVLSDIDRPRKIYRLNYSINEIDGGKRVGTRTFALIVPSGGKAELKQGFRIPVVTGAVNSGAPGPSDQVQYLDVGLNVDASLDGVHLNTKVEQSHVADEKSGVGAQDPVIRQTVLSATSTLQEGKPLVLGVLDVPGSTKQEEIEVVSELIH